MMSDSSIAPYAMHAAASAAAATPAAAGSQTCSTSSSCCCRCSRPAAHLHTSCGTGPPCRVAEQLWRAVPRAGAAWQRAVMMSSSKPCLGSGLWALARVPESWLRSLGSDVVISGPRESGARSARDLHKQI
ncbi:unnamed protein product [Merluccius merluccius]